VNLFLFQFIIWLQLSFNLSYLKQYAYSLGLLNMCGTRYGCIINTAYKTLYFTIITAIVLQFFEQAGQFRTHDRTSFPSFGHQEESLIRLRVELMTVWSSWHESNTSFRRGKKI